MINTIKAAIPTVTSVNEAIGVVASIPGDFTVSRIQQVFKKYASFIVSVTPMNVIGFSLGAARLNATARCLRALASTKDHPFPAILYTGSLINPKGLEQASNVIGNAINNINEILMSLKMRERSLEQVRTQLQTTIIESSAAADNYLNVDYEEAISKLLELNRQDKVLGLAFSLSEKTLNAVLKQLEQAAS